MKQLSRFASPLLVKATARPRRKGVILLRRIQRRVALLCVGIFALIYAPFHYGRKTSP